MTTMSENADEIIKPRGGKRKELPPVEFLRECFEYFPETGKLVWRRRPRHHFPDDGRWKAWNTINFGRDAGSRTRDYRSQEPKAIMIGFWMVGAFAAHLIIHALMGVEIPAHLEVDHKDGNPWNNRWDNLRIGTHQQNLCNLSVPRNKKSGLPLGVAEWNDGGKKPFQAYITFKRKRYPLGLHATLDEAVAARRAAEIKFFGDLPNGRRAG